VVALEAFGLKSQTGREKGTMHMNASEVGDWLRQVAGKRDHRKVVPDDSYLVLRPGPNFDWLMGNPVPTQPPASTPEPPMGGVRGPLPGALGAGQPPFERSA
jgi:hypothetical protein